MLSQSQKAIDHQTPERLVNHRGVRHAWTVSLSATAFFLIVWLVFDVIVRPSAVAMALITLVLALSCITCWIGWFVVPETPKWVELSPDGIIAQYFTKSKAYTAASIESCELAVDPVGAGIVIRMTGGETGALIDLDRIVADRIRGHLEKLGVAQRPTRYLFRRGA